MSRTTAQIISTLFNPVIDPAITFLLLTWTDQQLNLSKKMEFLGIAVLFSSGLMILCLLIFIRSGLINDLDIPNRRQRFLPLAVAAIVLFTGFLALSFAHAPYSIHGLMGCYATETLIVAIISYWWKISIHTAALGCSLVALTVQFGAIALLGYLLLPIVGQARIVLKRHTIAQTIAGAFLGIVLTTIQLLSFK